MRGEIVEHEGRRQDKAPAKVQSARGRTGAPPAGGVAQRDPAHLDAKARAWRPTAAERSRRASRIRKSCTRRGVKAGSPRTHSIASPPAARQRRGGSGDDSAADRADAARGAILCGTPRSGTLSPGAKPIFSGRWRSFAPIQAPCLSANDLPALKLARAGMVSTMSRAAVRTRRVKRFARRAAPHPDAKGFAAM